MTKLLTVFLTGLAFSFSVAAEAVSRGESVSWPGGGQGAVVFSGKEHAEKGLGCKTCHPAIFQMKKGSSKMTMAAMNKGAFCGTCHNGSSAFSTSDTRKCNKCHKENNIKKLRKHHDDGGGEEYYREHHD
jgi:c(7)-type cytochrome triheme protein